METDTIANLVEFVMDKVLNEQDEVTKTINRLSLDTTKFDLDDIIGKIRNMVGHIGVEENQFSLNLDLSVFDESLQPIDVVVKFDDGKLQSLEIKDLSIENFTIDLTASFQEYNAPVLEKARYVALEPAVGLVPTIMDLIKETSFRLEFDASVDKKDATANDVTFNGGLQFDIKDGFGYGDMTIVDSDRYEHRIKADMPSKDTFFFSYNEKLRGKFDSATILDIVDLIKDFTSGEDDHFVEIVNDITVDSELPSLIKSVLDGQYGVLLTYNIINNLEVTDEHIAFDTNLEVVGLEGMIHVVVGYDTDPETHYSDLRYLSVSGLELDEAVISLNIRLKKFNPELERTRLDPSLSYMDLSDIKVFIHFLIFFR